MLTPSAKTCNYKVTPSLSVVALLLACFAASSCTTVESQSFQVPKNSNVQSAKIATDANFGQYDRLLADDMGIFLPQGTYAPPEDLQRIRQIFRSAFLNELEGYAIVQEPGPRTMKVRASLIDLRHSTGIVIPKMRREIRDIAKPGSLVFLMELRDSESDRTLARASDSAEAPLFATADGTAADWSSVETAAQHWAALFRAFLDQNLAR